MDKLTEQEWRFVDIANHAGIKGTFNKRIKWTEKHFNKLESKCDDQLFQASVHALRTNQEDFPVRVDAAASGFQCLSLLTHDINGLKLNGLFSNGYQDIYLNLFNYTDLDKTQFSRKEIKKALMASSYGSINEPMKIFKTEEALQKYYSVLEEHIPGIYRFMTYAINGLWNPNAYNYTYRLPDGFIVNAEVTKSQKESISINGKDYEIIHKVNEPSKTGRILPSCIIHSVDGMIARELTYRCNYDQKRINYITKLIFKEFNNDEVYNSEDNDAVAQIWNDYLDSGFLSAKIVNHINGSNINLIDRDVIYKLILSLPKKSFYVIPLHDEFACRAEYVNDMREQYNHILRNIWNSNLLAHIINQFIHTEKLSMDPITKEHLAIGDKIFNSTYTIH